MSITSPHFATLEYGSELTTKDKLHVDKPLAEISIPHKPRSAW